MIMKYHGSCCVRVPVLLRLLITSAVGAATAGDVGYISSKAHSTKAQAECRCLPPDPCWSKIPWAALNSSVNGKLQKSVDELAACLTAYGGNIDSEECATALSNTDDEFWVTNQSNGYLHTGLFNEWNITNRISEYSVLAETEKDFQATVKFAGDYNLRLVVKGTGHDWYGRSAAGGSLLLWTHRRKNITWHDSFVASGCDAVAVPAVTLESGVQFQDLYPEAQKLGRIVMGGTCDSVGVGGCFTAGCYGPFTRKFGNAALNILEAKIVLANGSLVTTSKCSHPDLFMSIRGGGGGLAGVITEFTVRSHPSPRFMSHASFSGSATTFKGCKQLFAKVMQVKGSFVTQNISGALCDNGGLYWNCNENGGTSSVSCDMYEGNHTLMAQLFAPLLQWTKTQDGIKGDISSGISWNSSQYDPSDPNAHLPWMEKHPDREISTGLLASMSKTLPAHFMSTEEGSSVLAESLTTINNMLPSATLPTVTMMGAKAQGGMSPDLVEEFHTTGLNPVMLDSVGTWLIMYNIPDLPQMPPSSKLLQTLWPRLKKYAIRNSSDPLFKICELGSLGSEPDSVQCFSQWRSRIPALQAQLEKVRQALWKALPNEDAQGQPFSSSYWAETDYDDLDFQKSHWGAAYPKLLAVKDKYDPNGLFICHHCVGSERWTVESNLNCRKNEFAVGN